MSKVVYLMGAGASRGIRGRDGNGKEDPSYIVEGIPIVKEIPKRLEKITSVFSNLNFDDGMKYERTGVEVDLGSAKRNLIDGFHWLARHTERMTIDTFAKTLFLTEQKEDYIKLKRLLSIFLMTEQLINKPDSRYEIFLASVLQRKDSGELRITDDISILTWNYDSQFEIAYKPFLSAGYNPEDLAFPEFVGIDIHNRYVKSQLRQDDGKRQIFKLNGSASFASDYSMGHYHSYHNGNLMDDVAKVLLWTYDASYYHNGEKRYCLLNFAWDKENDEFERQYQLRLHNAIKDATALVIIGYTFPFFNRETDTMLIKGMPNLQNVYIQDPFAKNVKQSFVPVMQKAGLNIGENNIHLFDDVTQFLLPPEL